MKILIDINHPAHVHFFKNPIALLKNRGCEILVTSRHKDVTVELLDALSINHECLSGVKETGVVALLKELCFRDWALYKTVKSWSPDAMMSIGGTFIAHVSKLTGVPSYVFYDTENAVLQNAITYPFASKIFVPSCYESWVPEHKTIRYNGYHELSYLHPDYFKPDIDVAKKNGLVESSDNFFIRLVSWQANHDLGESGWNIALLEKVIAFLELQGNVIISTEAELPGKFNQYVYAGNVSDIHHVLAFCRLFIGESATVASEAAVLGVPAIYAAKTGRGYTNEQEKKYGLVKNITSLTEDSLLPIISHVLSDDAVYYQARRKELVNDCIDVVKLVVDSVGYMST